MEDYIVIILMAIILIFGAIGRSKKKVIPQPQNEEPIEHDDFWGMMEELEVQPPTPQPVKKVEFMKVPKVNPVYGFIAKEEGVSILKDRILKSESDIKKTNKSNIIKKDDKFSLRKAIIYSEILNRKYI